MVKIKWELVCRRFWLLQKKNKDWRKRIQSQGVVKVLLKFYSYFKQNLHLVCTIYTHSLNPSTLNPPTKLIILNILNIFNILIILIILINMFASMCIIVDAQPYFYFWLKTTRRLSTGNPAHHQKSISLLGASLSKQSESSPDSAST